MSSSTLSLPLINKRVICIQQPDPSRILVASNDLKIFQVQEENFFKKIFTLSEHQFNGQKCVDFTTDTANHSDYLAIGYGIGKISVLRLNYPNAPPTNNFMESSFYLSQNMTELLSKHNRACTALSFCPQNSSMLASGFDKLRNEPSILIWDIESQTGLRAVSPSTTEWTPTLEPHDLTASTKWGLEKSSSLIRDPNVPQRGLELRVPELSNQSGLIPPSLSKSLFTPFINNTSKPGGFVYPFLSAGPPEPVSSLAWLSSRQLVAGMSGKWLRLFDVREALTASQQWSTRTMLGITIDPFHSHRFATFSDYREGTQVIKLWDTRKPGDVYMQFNCSAHQLCFSRFQEHIFLIANEKISEYSIAEGGPLYLREKAKCTLAFDEFHPHTVVYLEENRDQAEKLSIVRLQAPPATALHPNGILVAAFETELRKFPSEPDIALEMKLRAESGYAMDITKNMALFQEKDNMLFNVWSWIGCMDQLLTSGRAQLGGLDFSYQGLHRVLQGLSENASISYHDTLSTVYTSPQRKLALSICGWLGPKELELEIAQLESDGLFEKAAFLSFLHSDLQRCIKSLLLSKDRNHHLVCGTIAGFTPSHPNPSWVNLCLQLSKETASPELCAVFTFFATSNWQDVIQSELKMREKLLIALRYLNDTALVEYVDAEGRQTIQKGSLDGLLFTGLSTEAVDIFSEYVDRTGDIQTASLVLSIVVPKRFKDTKVEEWIESYRKYLDQLQLFHIRAMFDIQHAKHAEGEFVIPPQVSISCDYCNQSISHSSSATLSKGNLPSMSPKVKLTVCPHCCKPLPRCSLCLLTLGAPIEKLSGNKGSKSYLPLEFARWITWCQNCHHGGHAVHLMEWFAKYDICPISDCNCQCAQL